MINLSKESMQEAFLEYLGEIFEHPEVLSACAKEIIITRETINEAGKEAFEAGFHDIYSDIDLSVKVCLPENGSVTAEDYMKRIDRFGVSKDTALGWMFVPIHRMFRIIFKNGMRYDFGFDFVYEGDYSPVFDDCIKEEENANWPLENIRQFWFIQIQALGKLYRKDYLIGSHLANMNCNYTLTMQMVLRDLKYKTNHHRYGYGEELEYTKDLKNNPYRTDDPTFNLIADMLYSAALAYDRLAKNFYPDIEGGSDTFFAIWDSYEEFGNS